ncbi:ABC transporter permease subunit [Streptomyces sp. XD-27]|uniref:ABC transporter permease subunit n=1 Tax=Streptomyces sp. XD-27 TaxID=3062779 RepID=UPI0026F4420B|nr:ABC transporter permease subunit [Streptomyces sp. XD-27]WKX72647.1 ABC transporter permease subunit [Streptomyces sp. XD-27]
MTTPQQPQAPAHPPQHQPPAPPQGAVPHAQAPAPQQHAYAAPGAAPAQVQAQQAYAAAAPAQPQPQPQAQGTGSVPGYVSPIPIQRTHLGHALASEWTKIKSVRSTMWTLGVMIALVIGIGFITVSAAASSDNLDLDGNSTLWLGFFGVLLGTLCIITLGVLVISSEYGTGMIRTTLTACPNRSRVLTAKAVVFFLVAFAVTLVCTTLVALIADSMVGDMQGAVAATDEEWFKSTVGVSLYMAMLGLFALGVGALIRHSAGAITSVIGVVLLPLVMALFMQGASLEDMRKFLIEYSVPIQLAVMYGDSGAESGPSGWEPLWIMTGMAAAALVAAYAMLDKRDV